MTTAVVGEDSRVDQRDLSRRARADTIVVVFSGALLLAVIAAAAAPLLARYQPDKTDILNADSGPSGAHWLGTDGLGRDIFSRLLYGARLSLLGPVLVIVLSTILGVALAVSAVWLRGWYGLAVARVLDLLFAVPALLVAILAVAFVGTGLLAPVIALSVAFTPYAARVVQSVVSSERELAYIEACELVGFGGWRTCIRHLIPNVMPMIRAQAVISFGPALVALAAVSYLGLGVQPPTAEWGLMVAEGQTDLINGHPLEALSAGMVVVMVVVLTNLLGSRLEVLAERAT